MRRKSDVRVWLLEQLEHTEKTNRGTRKTCGSGPRSVKNREHPPEIDFEKGAHSGQR